MKTRCPSCDSQLSQRAIEEGYCADCEYQFNPQQEKWENESPELYEGTFTTIAGDEASISKMAEQLLHGKILKRFGLFAVTTVGIECLDHYYCINKDRLESEDWTGHMSMKNWVNMSDFESALKYAKENS